MDKFKQVISVIGISHPKQLLQTLGAFSHELIYTIVDVMRDSLGSKCLTCGLERVNFEFNLINKIEDTGY